MTRQVLLTIDVEYPDREHGEGKLWDIVRALDHKPAVLFFEGRWAEAHPQQLESVAEFQELLIGNHGYWHVDRGQVEDAAPSLDAVNFIKGYHVLVRILGEKRLLPLLARFPYGGNPPGVAEICGARVLGWDIHCDDCVFRRPQLVFEELVSKTKECVKEPAIVLLHHWAENTEQVLADYIKWCKAEGITFAERPTRSSTRRINDAAESLPARPAE